MRSKLARMLAVAALLAGGLGVAPTTRVPAASALPPVTWYVRQAAGSDSGTGADCPNGFLTIGHAISQAGAGDTIHFCADYDVAAEVTVDKDLTFEGDGSTNTLVQGDGSFRLFDADGIDVVFRDLELSGGSAGVGYGGAIRGANVRILRSRLTANDAAYGGAIYVTGTVEVTGSTFALNISTADGGAIRGSGPVSVDDSVFISNSSGDDGGAIFTVSGSISMRHVTFIGNRTDGPGAIAPHGGAVYSDSGLVSVEYGTFAANNAARLGGAIATNSGVIVVTHGVFTENTSGSGGGAIQTNLGEVTVSDGTFIRNSATAGGAINVYGDGSGYPGRLRVTDAVFTDNVARNVPAAGYGGAIYAARSLEITGATFTGNRAAQQGGALRTAYGPLTATDVHFNDNTAGSFGGAIVSGGITSIRDADLTRNTAGSYGGAIATVDTIALDSLTVQDANLVGNRSASDGGAIRTNSAAVTLGNARFTDNSSGNDGGAIRTGTGAVSMSDATFTGNSATNQGGAIRSGGPVDMIDATFSSNTSGDDGGALFVTGVNPVTVLRSTFSQNRSLSTLGGAIYLGGEASGGPIAIEASTFDRNQAASGGAIYGGSTRATIRNATFYANVVGGNGGALHVGGGVDVTNGTFVDNQPGEGVGGSIYAPSAAIHADDTIFSGGSCTAASVTGSGSFAGPGASGCGGTSATSGDLNLGTLANWGGPTETVNLLTPSVAIDGTPTVADSCLSAVDQRGTARPQREACDAGAFEAAQPVNVWYNGPWRVNASASPVAISVAAWVDPAVAGCLVRFDLTGNTYSSSGASQQITETTSGTTDVRGLVSAPVTLPQGIYDVRVSVVPGECFGLNVSEDVLAILPGSVPKGSVGGGWYRLPNTDGTGSWRKNSFGHVFSVRSALNKRTGVTTTTTQAMLVWYSTADSSAGGAGWRLKANIWSTTTDGSSIWQPFGCPSWVGLAGSGAICGRLTATAILQQRDQGGRWLRYGPGPVTFTATVYDGGRLTSCNRKVCRTTELADYFGLTIVGIPMPTSASQPLPQLSAPIRLKGGEMHNT